MAHEKRIATLFVLLAIVLATIGFIYTGQVDISKSVLDAKNSSNADTVYVELTHNVSKSDVRNLVSDRFSHTETDDGYIIVAGSDGSKYVVSSGTILVDNKIIRVTKEGSSIVVLENRD